MIVECDYCKKLVRFKWVIGTAHLCLTPEERQAMDEDHEDEEKVVVNNASWCPTPAQAKKAASVLHLAANHPDGIISDVCDCGSDYMEAEND